MKKLLLIPLIATLFSCKSTYTNTLATAMYSPVAEINPIRAEVDVDMNKKLTGTSAGSYFLCFQVSGDSKYADGMSFSGEKKSRWQGRLNKLKAAAAYKAVSETKADIVVHPNYVIDIHNYIFFKTVKIKVFGFAGYFKKFYQEPYNGNETHHGSSEEKNILEKIRF